MRRNWENIALLDSNYCFSLKVSLFVFSILLSHFISSLASSSMLKQTMLFWLGLRRLTDISISVIVYVFDITPHSFELQLQSFGFFLGLTAVVPSGHKGQRTDIKECERLFLNTNLDLGAKIRLKCNASKIIYKSSASVLHLFEKFSGNKKL